jgi:hypothetical protein
MKRHITIWLCSILVMELSAQSQFVPADYMDFIQTNKTLDAEGFLQKYPAQTTYYSSRTYPAALESIPWFDTINDRYHLTTGELDLLKNNYFMVTERLQFNSWLAALAQIYTEDMPLFLSTDFILHTLHQSYDEILKTIEVKMLEPNLIVLLDGLYDYFPTVYNKYKDETQLGVSLADVDLYISVAKSLLENEIILPQFTNREKYDEVMLAIKNEEMVEMPLFTKEQITRKLDFSQFKPRGHYIDIIWGAGGEKTLEDYFRAMMWLGRIDFLLTAPPENPWEPEWEDKDLLRMNLSALMLNETLEGCGKNELFEKHEEIISYMVGPDDNMTPEELLDLTTENLSSPMDLLNENTFSEFKSLLNASDDYGQKIMSNFFYVDPEVTDPGKLPVSFKLLGQKFLIDSYVFSEVVYDRIEFDGQKVWRPLPDPLDMISVFGNEDAMALMKDEMKTYKYAYKISQLKYLVDSYDDDFWTQSLYNTWLSGLIKLNPLPSASELPYFMQTTAWHHEKLNTQLTSWAQLRHDNILYGKQSYTGGTGCSYPYTYVEPYPEFYSYLATFATNASAFFEEALSEQDANLSSSIISFYDGYAEIMEQLKEIASKELTKTTLSDEELIFLKTMINEYMSSGPSVSGWINDLLFYAEGRWDSDFTVADVHTQPTDESGALVGNVLHVGNGNINLGVFIAPNPVNPGLKNCYIGPLSSFHTEVKRDFYRYNDIEWEEKFREGKVPERPDWVYAYLADANGNVGDPPVVLKGVEYTGTELEPKKVQDLSYLLAYPNPASREVHFRFILWDESRISAEVFDVTGRKTDILYSGILPAAEHDLQMDLADRSPGVYFIRLHVNEHLFVKRFIVQ